ncbi:MAG: hypothetical protein K6F07_03225 [Bacilli bacterium]|nr:hypothetical protein [Bacilli bacterium]
MNRKLFLLAASLLLVGCNNNASKQNEKKEPDAKAAYAATLKKAGDDMFDYMGANRTRGHIPAQGALDPLVTGDKMMYLSMPSVLVYMSGLISEVDGVDIDNHMFEFGGDYQYKLGENWTDINLIFAVNAKINKADNQIFLNARQFTTIEGMGANTTDVFIDINFDFEGNEVKSFELYQDQGPDYAYVVVDEEGVGKIRNAQTQLTDEEAAKLDSTFATYSANLEALYAQKVSSTEANNRTCMEKFVQTQLYQNSLLGMEEDVRIKE